MLSVAQTLLFLNNGHLDLPLLIFVFSASLFTYATHRIVGLQKVEPFQDKGRYLVISTFKSHIVVYAIIAAVTSFISFWWLNLTVKISLLIPAIISLGYVLPILAKGRRFRDIHFIKIFLIAIVWAWVGVGLTALEIGYPFGANIWWMIAERIFFIFAITIPFDIRDLQIDQHTEVKTIPSLIGIRNSKFLALFALSLVLICCWMNVHLGTYNLNNWWAFLISVISTALLIIYADYKRHDYYYTALLDGTIIFQFLLLYFLQ